MCDLPLFSPDALTTNVGPLVSGLLDPYVYFGATTDGRDRLQYNPGDADPALIAQDDALIEPIASSELHTLAAQPARVFDPLVNVPVLVTFGQQDGTFLPACQTSQADLYVTSPSVSTLVLPDAGHALMLHRNAGAFESELLRWLKDH